LDDRQLDGHDGKYAARVAVLVGRLPALGSCPLSVRWLSLQQDLGRSPRAVIAYARSLVDYLAYCDRAGVEIETAGRAEIAGYVRDLRGRPERHGANVISLTSGGGLANATLQLRITVVRLFYDFLVEERVRDRNPVARGIAPGTVAGRRGLVARLDPLPWIPTDAQWRAILEVTAGESLRNRLMLALAYDAALRREELCLLRADDLDPAHRTITVRAETTRGARMTALVAVGEAVPERRWTPLILPERYDRLPVLASEERHALRRVESRPVRWPAGTRDALSRLVGPIDDVIAAAGYGPGAWVCSPRR
jgi:site-specific recombinase XerC